MARARRPPTQAVSAKISPAPCAPRRKVLPVPRRPRPRREGHLEAVAGALMLWRTRRRDRDTNDQRSLPSFITQLAARKLTCRSETSCPVGLHFAARGGAQTMARASVPSTSISPSPCSRIFPRRPRAGTGRRAVRASKRAPMGTLGTEGRMPTPPCRKRSFARRSRSAGSC